ncbi:hypothetical protein C8N46_102137 [Kordia periserrulae]|uniref:Uncharacterized protein n=1 Tax=Kordia periserrulae TaxID=701523 RepID=A0A2T6C3B4_9FLAO|nr:hypothetical protein [Kordia periserrulae]PTX62737.1 hypothetical protein C8N46_102137 [Kordia periserrulae]
MSKTIVLNDKIKNSIRSVKVRNDDTIFSIKINKNWLTALLKRMAFTGVLTGYVLITYLSYSINVTHFWTLVKVGVILVLLSFFMQIPNKN